MEISDGINVSQTIKVTKGVLRREILSPLIFLFIYDLEEFEKNKGMRRGSITNLTEILLFRYAEDKVIFADPLIYMRKILNHLHEYCKNKRLAINVSKKNHSISKWAQK